MRSGRGMSSVGRTLAILAVAAIGCPATVPAAAAEVRQPTGKWVVEFAENECLLSRAYGTDSKPLYLGFIQAPMSAGIQLLVLKPSKDARLGHGEARVSFGGRAPVEAGYGAFLSHMQDPAEAGSVRTCFGHGW